MKDRLVQKRKLIIFLTTRLKNFIENVNTIYLIDISFNCKFIAFSGFFYFNRLSFLIIRFASFTLSSGRCLNQLIL